MNAAPTITLLTPDYLSETLGHAPIYWQRQARAKRIPHTRVGREIRFTPEQVAQIIAQSAVTPATPSAAAPAPVHADPLASVVTRRTGSGRAR